MARIISILIIAFGVLLHSWPNDLGAAPLKNRSLIGLRIGAFFLKKDAVQDGVPIVENTSGTENLISGLIFTRWLQESLAVTLAVSALESGTRNTISTSGISNETKTVISLMFGIRYYLPKSTYKSAYRPYLAAGAGPVLWSGTWNEIRASEVVSFSGTMKAFGSHFGGGVDIELSRHFMLGANMGYNLMSDFSDIEVGKNNYSSFEFAMAIGYLWGKGIQ